MNGLLLIDKETDMTSHDLVNIVRRQLDMKRVGHTGTLDPNATGLMMVAVGKATKLVPYLQTDSKEYILEMQLGILTDTLDIWGETIKEVNYTKPSKAEVKSALLSFIGKQQQIPPMYSAIKIDGKKLYELARAGKTVDVPPRQIEIFDIELLEYSNLIKARVHCSSGTYIRTLCLDIAKKLNTVGVMTSLVRTKIGNFTLEQATSIKDLKNNDFNLLKPKDVLSGYPVVNYEKYSDIKNGRRINLETRDDLVLIKVAGEILAFYEREEGKTFKSKRGLW